MGARIAMRRLGKDEPYGRSSARELDFTIGNFFPASGGCQRPEPDMSFAVGFVNIRARDHPDQRNALGDGGGLRYGQAG